MATGSIVGSIGQFRLNLKLSKPLQSVAVQTETIMMSDTEILRERAHGPSPSRTLASPPRPADGLGQRLGQGLRSGLGNPLVWMLTGFALLTLPSLNTPIVDHHSFRQTQTAMYMRGLLRSGFDLFHPRLQSFGVGGVVPFEFPWYSAIAALLSRTGVSETAALRVTSLAFTLLAAIAVARLTTIISGRTGGLAAAAGYLFCPFTFVWGQASMIESFTVATCLWWILISRRAVESPGSQQRVYVTANVLGVIAVTSKSTTAVVWLPVLFVALRPWVRPTVRRWLRCAAVTVVPVIGGAIWTRWSDGLRAKSELSAWLTNASLGHWYFGPVSQRTQWANWVTIGTRVPLILGFTGLVITALGLLSVRRQAQPLLALGIASVPLVSVLIFFNLYQVHDYYLAAVTPAFACIFGCGVARALAAVTVARRATAAAFIAAAQVIGFGATGFNYIVPTIAATAPRYEFTSLSSPSEGVLVTGQGWDPDVHYFADRSGIALQTPQINPAQILAMPESITGPISILYIGLNGLDADAEAVMRSQNLLLVIGERSYRWVASPTYPSYLLRWTGIPAAQAINSATTNGAKTDQRVQQLICNGEPQQLDGPPSGSTRFLITGDRPGVWLQFGEHVGAIPVRPGTIELAKPTRTVRCFAGTDSAPEATVPYELLQLTFDSDHLSGKAVGLSTVPAG